MIQFPKFDPAVLLGHLTRILILLCLASLLLWACASILSPHTKIHLSYSQALAISALVWWYAILTRKTLRR